jgi:phosphate transport system protein
LDEFHVGGKKMIPYRQRYHRDLSELKSLTKDLADHVGAAIEKSVVALSDSNVELAREIIKKDQDMDDLSQRIENLCMELLALQ